MSLSGITLYCINGDGGDDI